VKLSKFAIPALAFAAAMAAAPAAFATAPTTETIVLGTSNQPSIFSNQDMAHLTITQVGADTLWTLAANWDNSLNSRNPFIFGLQFNNAKTNAPVDFNVAPGSTIGLANSSPLTATSVSFETSNGHGGANRFTDGETAKWTFKNTTLSDFSAFQLHVNSVTLTGGSVKFTQLTPVPEPETYGMLLGGLGLIGFVARRRRAAK
jgi:hypothetical protein